MATLNIELFQKELTRQLKNNKAVRNIAFENAKPQFDEFKKDALKEFEDHPITQEINEGRDATNISDTLSDLGDRPGNLFTFIGFRQGTKPAEELKEFLNENITLTTLVEDTIEKRDSITFKFRALIPDKNEIAKATPMPWGNGRSWALGIERGISGLGSYLYSKMFNPERSFENVADARSGKGAQAKNSLRSAIFKNQSYLTQILNNFKNRFKK